MAASSTAAGKRCLYEVLGVARDSSPEEIRSAYRRLALKLHPDKVVASSGAAAAADATAAFQELLHAYEVLSDPKERSWYDSHRSQILFSDASSGSKKSSSFADFDLFSYFSKSAFSGFSDTGKGFYKVYGDLFGKVYAQELFFVKQMGLRADAVPPAPLIGNLDSPYSQVTAFYSYWLGFSTVMDFGWVDEYDVSMAPNRRTKRFMEEGNMKLRKKAKREYNDSVRGLAAFAKKRDKRVVDMMMKKTMEEEKRRAEEKAKKKAEEQKKMERARAYEEPEWAKIDERDDDVFDELEADDDKSKKVTEEFYCVVCNKKFKSDKQWKNHEQSKKHRDKVAELRTAFEEEDADVVSEEELNDSEGFQVGFDYEPPASEDSDVVDSEEFQDVTDELCKDFQDDFELTENNGNYENAEEMDDEDSILEAMISGKKNRKNKSTVQHELTPNSDNETGDIKENYMEYGTRKKGRRNRASRKGSTEPEAEVTKEETSESQADYGEIQNLEPIIENNEFSVKEASGRGNESQPAGKNQKSKKQQVDKKSAGKKNAAVAPSMELKESKGRKQKAASKIPTCDACGERFETRNKLFAHLGDTGHATLKSK